MVGDTIEATQLSLKLVMDVRYTAEATTHLSDIFIGTCQATSPCNDYAAMKDPLESINV